MEILGPSQKKVCGHNILKENRVTYYSWGVNIISQTKGRINRFLWPAKVF